MRNPESKGNIASRNLPPEDYIVFLPPHTPHNSTHPNLPQKQALLPERPMEEKFFDQLPTTPSPYEVANIVERVEETMSNDPSKNTTLKNMVKVLHCLHVKNTTIWPNQKGPSGQEPIQGVNSFLQNLPQK